MGLEMAVITEDFAIRALSFLWTFASGQGQRSREFKNEKLIALRRDNEFNKRSRCVLKWKLILISIRFYS